MHVDISKSGACHFIDDTSRNVFFQWMMEEDVFIIVSLLSWKLVYIIVKQSVCKVLTFLCLIIASYCIYF